MPKGVEHKVDNDLLNGANPARLSLMPKGVEHDEDGFDDEYIVAGATLFDAERR